MRREAAEIGPATCPFGYDHEGQAHPEQGFRACLGILRLARRYRSTRIDAACRRGNDIGEITHCSIKSILQHGLDRACADEKPPDAPAILHRNAHLSNHGDFSVVYQSLAVRDLKGGIAVKFHNRFSVERFYTCFFQVAGLLS